MQKGHIKDTAILIDKGSPEQNGALKIALGYRGDSLALATTDDKQASGYERGAD